MLACFASLRAFPFKRGAFATGSSFAVLAMLIAYPHLEPASQSHLTKIDVSFLYFLYVLSRKAGSMLSFESLIVGLITDGGSAKLQATFSPMCRYRKLNLSDAGQKGKGERSAPPNSMSFRLHFEAVSRKRKRIWGRRPLVGPKSLAKCSAKVPRLRHAGIFVKGHFLPTI